MRASGTNALIPTSGRRLNINVDGFNSQRDIEIAKGAGNCFHWPLLFIRNWIENGGDDGSSAAVGKGESY